VRHFEIAYLLEMCIVVVFVERMVRECLVKFVAVRVEVLISCIG